MTSKTTNAAVIAAFLDGTSARSGSMTARWQRAAPHVPATPALASYETEIAYHVGQYVYVNPTRYSVTTSKQRTQLIQRLGERVPEADMPLEVLGPKEPYCARRYVTTTFHAYRRS